MPPFLAQALDAHDAALGRGESVLKDDARTAGGSGAITLVAWALGYNGATGNNFFRTTILTMNMVPEPGSMAGLAAGAAGLLGLVWLRRRTRV